MRVIAGSAKGRRLRIRRKPAIRPTRDRVKEALFNILRDRVPGAAFLDLYSGFGGIGIEALSRGAREAVFVENDAEAVLTLEANIAACGFSQNSVVHQMDIFRFLKTSRETFDLVFADPPYQDRTLRKLLPAVGGGVIMSADGLFILEHFKKTKIPSQISGLENIRSYGHGDSILSFFRKGEPGA